jgi:hypothetical protein
MNETDQPKPRRGGPRPGAGSKPYYSNRMRRADVMLTQQQFDKAKGLGNGKLGVGVRKAIDQAD